MKKILVFILLLTALSVQAGLPVSVERILAQVIASDGYVNENMHRDFWLELNKIGTEAEIEKAFNSINATILLSQEYQKETWHSVLISYQNKAVVRTDRMVVLPEIILETYKASIDYPKGSSQYNAGVNELTNRQRVANSNADKLLHTAAKRTAFKSPGRADFVMTKQSITFVIDNVESSFSRLTKLMNKKWQK